MKTNYTKLDATLIMVELEEGFLAGSKDPVVNEDTKVVIDEQEGGNRIVFEGWDN